MTSREIIIELINKQIINGQEAFTLINDLLKAELLEAWDTLNASKEKSSSRLTISDLNSVWVSNPNYLSNTAYGVTCSDTAYAANTASNK